MNVSLWLWVGLWAGGPALVEDFEALPAERQTTGIAGAALRGGGGNGR